MPSSHLIFCHPLFLLPPIPPSIRIFSNESTLHMSWPKYWSFSFSISPSNEHPGLIFFRMGWLDPSFSYYELPNLPRFLGYKGGWTWFHAFIGWLCSFMNGLFTSFVHFSFVGLSISDFLKNDLFWLRLLIACDSIWLELGQVSSESAARRQWDRWARGLPQGGSVAKGEGGEGQGLLWPRAGSRASEPTDFSSVSQPSGLTGSVVSWCCPILQSQAALSAFSPCWRPNMVARPCPHTMTFQLEHTQRSLCL